MLGVIMYFSLRFLCLFVALMFSSSVMAETSSTEQAISNEQFYLQEVDKVISERLSFVLGGDIKCRELSISRQGSDNVYTMSDVRNLQIRTKYIIDDLQINSGDVANLNGFSAIIRTDSEKAIALEVSGYYSTQVEVPVLNKSLSAGSDIRESDISFDKVDEFDVSATVITEKETLIGKSLKRNISAGKILRFSDISTPTMVERDKTVTAIFKHKLLTVKALAKPLQDGKKDDIIKLKNIDSGKIFQAKVSDYNEVIISGDRLSEVTLLD